MGFYDKSYFVEAYRGKDGVEYISNVRQVIVDSFRTGNGLILAMLFQDIQFLKFYEIPVRYCTEILESPFIIQRFFRGVVARSRYKRLKISNSYLVCRTSVPWVIVKEILSYT